MNIGKPVRVIDVELAPDEKPEPVPQQQPVPVAEPEPQPA